MRPPFRPPKDHLNCDPSLELEEMIVEAKPLHKKKKRLAKQRSIQQVTDIEATPLIKEFLVYNRFKELHRREMEQKESDWEQELTEAMANSEVIQLGKGDPTDGKQVDKFDKVVAIDFIDRTPSPKSSVS